MKENGKMAFLCKLTVLLVYFISGKALGLQFENELVFDENCTLLWNIGTDNEVIFEVQARTFGYVGIGFSKNGELSGSDVVVVWMNNGDGHIEVSGSLLSRFTYLFF
jgi:DOMON domain